ncbi:MAG: polysaccharide pyruvyl transferase family protein [Lachnospiraceae bacterium]|nr:polysaccharide pyruvyl transferase family protein [Lachnospiraceae bacterium]
MCNYGSFLQSYALQKAIEKLGNEAVIIDYIREDEEYHKRINIALKKSKRWNKNLLMRTIYKVSRYPETVLMERKFAQFRKKHLNMTKLYTSIQELEKDKPQADIYCTGSDQVWGPISLDNYDPAYCLDFTNDEDVKISYAASFGKTKFEGDTMLYFANALKKYKYLSVRENSATEIISGMGIDKVEQVLDPTLLLNSDEWSKLIEKEISGKYVLVYQIHSNPELDKYAEEFAKKVNLPLLRVSFYLHQVSRSGKLIYLPTIGEFLSYIKNAEYMITDSFHGTAFAINFNTQFVNVVHDETATRNQSLLQLTGLTDRIVIDKKNFDIFNKKIDFSKVNEIIEENRKKSVDRLKVFLEK